MSQQNIQRCTTSWRRVFQQHSLLHFFFTLSSPRAAFQAYPFVEQDIRGALSVPRMLRLGVALRLLHVPEQLPSPPSGRRHSLTRDRCGLRGCRRVRCVRSAVAPCAAARFFAQAGCGTGLRCSQGLLQPDHAFGAPQALGARAAVQRPVQQSVVRVLEECLRSFGVATIVVRLNNIFYVHNPQLFFFEEPRVVLWWDSALFLGEQILERTVWFVWCRVCVNIRNNNFSENAGSGRAERRRR